MAMHIIAFIAESFLCIKKEKNFSNQCCNNVFNELLLLIRESTAIMVNCIIRFLSEILCIEVLRAGKKKNSF